uniref:Uncharacterized protein n=1 Tax=Lepeophtheirus salmonis TaxID=72036 RepID=A0A0K2T8P5_LEPSM
MDGAPFSQIEFHQKRHDSFAFPHYECLIRYELIPFHEFAPS